MTLYDSLAIVIQFAMLVPVGLALCYSILAATMVYLPGEYAGCSLDRILKALVVPIIIRSIVLAVLLFPLNKSHVKGGKDLNTWNQFALVIASLISLRLAYKFIKQTRWNVIVGCTNPSDKLNTNEGQQTAFIDSNEHLVMVITGANSGIGKETAIQLAILSAKRKRSDAKTTIILACRTIKKGLTVKQEILQQLTESTKVTIELLELELCSFDSIRKAVATLTSSHAAIHCLINNAGVMMKDQSITADNHETTLQANYLGHFLLTSLLLPYIVPNTNSRHESIYYIPRVLNLTSCTYALVAKDKGLPLDDLNCNSRKYTMFQQYSVSKICNILHTVSLAQQYPTIFTASIHPGLVRTDVVRNMPLFMRYGNQAFGWIMKFLQKEPSQGAWCTVDVAALIMDCSPANSGKYWLNCHTHPIVYCNNDQERMTNDSTRLWLDSTKMVHLSDQEIEIMQSIATSGLQHRTSTILIHTRDQKKNV